MAKMPSASDAVDAATPELSQEELSRTIDRMGELKALMAPLEKEFEQLKKSVQAAVGMGAAEGEMFRVTVSLSQRESLDMEAVRAHLSPQFIRAHTKVTDVTTVRVTARKGSE